jgi:hypothetical protein
LGSLEIHDDAGLDFGSNHFLFRPDTLHTHAEILQDTMLGMFRQANDISCVVASATRQCPTPTTELFCHGASNPLHDVLFFDNDSTDIAFTWCALELLPGQVRENIIRRLSHRSGIVRMDNDEKMFQ